MQYIGRKQLAIKELRDEENTLSLDIIKKIILDRPSDVIYCEREGKLYGIISMGDVSRASDAREDCVVVNTHFTSVKNNEYMKARDIFKKMQKIHTLPIVNESGVVEGAYLREDDLMFLTHLISCVGGAFDTDSHIVFVCPCKSFKYKQRLFWECYKLLRLRGMQVIWIENSEILNYIDKTDWVVFADEDEYRGLDTLYAKISQCLFGREKFITCKRYFEYLDKQNVDKWLGILRSRGVYVFNLRFADNEYARWLNNEITENLILHGKKPNEPIPPDMRMEFFDDLYSEEYAKSILSINFAVETQSGCGKLKDCSEEYYHVIEGERVTIGQPEAYQNTIYFIGPCFIYGHYVEDKNTIESLLQKRFNQAGYKIRVVNCGSVYYSGSINAVWARILSIPFKKGDAIILYMDNRCLKEAEKINLIDILEKNKIGAKWLIDAPSHCNHKINDLYAEVIYNKLQSAFLKTVEVQDEMIVKRKIDFVKKIYIDRYFSDINITKYENVGAIVMNCNPFTNGHRHLIEQALEKVDFLIIFVVEEDKSLFTFTERFAMVCEGVGDFRNVLVVPSGSFILSQTSFPEYFVKAEDEELVTNTENDIVFFAERIAPHLNIKYRFVGEEPEDKVTNTYNFAMKKILPQKGIELIEIPRKKQNGRYISASSVRECLEKNNYSGFKELVPQSTVKALFSYGYGDSGNI